MLYLSVTDNVCHPCYIYQ